MKNSKIKKILSKIYGYLPLFLLKKLFLVKYIHHKPIPQSINSFYISGTNIKIINADSPITKILFWLGINGYERFENELWKTLCKNSKNIVEIGGNIGLYTLIGAKSNPSAKYIVYEPFPYNFQVLKKNIQLNNLNNVIAINAAVTSGCTKKIKFIVPEGESIYSAPTGGFIENSELKLDGYMSIEVDCVSSVEAISGCDLIKIDAEGAEFEILSSAQNIIIQERPIILVEVLKDSINLKGLIVNCIENYNYKAAIFDNRGNFNKLTYIEIEKINFFTIFGSRDIILYPAENDINSKYNFI